MKKKSIVNGQCVKCWNSAKTVLCKRGLRQDQDIKECRWYSGSKND